jgi:hypothetical protein
LRFDREDEQTTETQRRREEHNKKLCVFVPLWFKPVRFLDDGEPFEEKMERLAMKLGEQFAESARLEATIRENLERLSFEIWSGG